MRGTRIKAKFVKQLNIGLKKVLTMSTDKMIATLSKEDPERVKCFFRDLSEDRRLSPDMRSIFGRIYFGLVEGKSLEVVMNEDQKDVVRTVHAKITSSTDGIGENSP